MDLKPSIPRIVQLAATISESVSKMHEILSAQEVPYPSFEEDAPTSLPKEASDAQDSVLDATAELYDLLLEPLNLIYKHHGVRIMYLGLKMSLVTDARTAQQFGLFTSHCSFRHRQHDPTKRKRFLLADRPPGWIGRKYFNPPSSTCHDNAHIP